MILYVDLKTNVKDAVIDYLTIRLNNGEEKALSWDESGYSRTEDGFSARFKGVYLDEDYADGSEDLFKGAVVINGQYYSELEPLEDEYMRFDVDLEFAAHNGEIIEVGVSPDFFWDTEGPSAEIRPHAVIAV